MPKTYALEIERLVDDSGETVTFWSKGHHTPEEFRKAIADWNGETYDSSPVHHVYCRRGWMMLDGERCWSIFPGKQGERGVFPVTQLDLD